MTGLVEQLEICLAGRVCLIGLGNVDLGDDGFGVRLAEALLERSESRGASGCAGWNRPAGVDEFAFRARGFGQERRVLVAGSNPERFIGRAVDAGFDDVIFLDAVEWGGAPGSMIFLNSSQIVGRFPQVSTHKLALGLLAKCLEANGKTRAWLLGVQPESLKPGNGLSPTIRKSVQVLSELIGGVISAVPAAAAIRFQTKPVNPPARNA